MTAKVEVRPGSDADLATLVAVLGERHFFTDSLARQQRGGGVLLVAWLDGQAEDSARQLGYVRIRLSVGLDTLRARRLYERLGYAAWGRGTVVGPG